MICAVVDYGHINHGHLSMLYADMLNSIYSCTLACDVDLHFELIHITCVGRCVTVFLTTPTGSSQGGS